MDKNQFLEVFFPAAMTFLGVVVPALLAWMGAILRSWAVKQKEKIDREALHSALKTGAEAAEQKYSGGTQAMVGERVSFAIDYARKSVPEAIENLKPDDATLTKLAVAKFQQVEEKPCHENPSSYRHPTGA